MADLNEIMDGRNTPEPDHVPAPQASPEPPQAPPAAPSPSEPAPEEDPVSGLRKALDEERGKRRRYKEELAGVRDELASMRRELMQSLQSAQQQRQPQTPPLPPPDWFVDPDAAFHARLRGEVEPLQRTFDQQVQGIRQETQATRHDVSRMVAEQAFGSERVDGAYGAFQEFERSNPQAAAFEAQRILAAKHPWGELVQWHKRQAVLQEVGEDTAAYRERVRQEVLSEFQQQQQPAPAGNGAAPQTQARVMPGNFAQGRNAGQRSTPQWSGPKPLSEIFKR